MSEAPIYSHVAFSDDSGHGDGRYNSLGLVTFPFEYEKSLRNELEILFVSAGINSEFKWHDVSSARHRFAAEGLQTFIFNHLDKIRVDVLVWDMKDTRHKDIPGRDDNANIARMYYHLLENTLKRWGYNSSWLWKPDKQSPMDWRTLADCLVHKKHLLAADLFGIDEDDFVKLKLKMIKVVDSRKEIFVQLADYFAGLGAYSYGHFGKYKEWKIIQAGQISLFGNMKSIKNWSNSEKARFPLIDSFYEGCKNRALTVSLDSTSGFETHDPSKPVNFWPYRPQHALDKAPASEVFS